MNNHKDNLIEETKKIFFEKFSHDAEVLSISPGRVNIIGEHVDYTLGLSMPAAIDRYLCVGISKNNNKKIHAYSENLNESFLANLNEISNYKIWHKYVQGSIVEALGANSSDYGINIVINSNIPIGKGVSSSAALELSIVCSILNLFNMHLTNNEIIDMCQRVDHKHIGIKSGKLDQSACLLSKKDSVFIIDFTDFSIDYISMESDNASWILIDSSIKRELASSKYHERVDECENAFKFLSSRVENFKNFRDIDKNQPRILDLLAPNLQKRVRHIISENQRVLRMKDAIKNNSVERIGSILQESHNSLRYNYEVSCKEIDYLIESSEKLDYWLGGRIMGGGFGGSTINLVKKEYENIYIEKISSFYKKKFNLICESMRISFVDGVKTMDNISAN